MQEVFGNYKDILRRIPDLRKAERILGYRPKHSMEEAIRKTLESVGQGTSPPG
jgi:nucleoside-diphosphate-sugar epimerase